MVSVNEKVETGKKMSKTVLRGLHGDNIGYQFSGDEGHSLYYYDTERFAKILVHDKMGSTTLRSLENETLSIEDKIDWDTFINGYLICLIRNPIDKYKSAIKEKYIEHFSGSLKKGKDDLYHQYYLLLGLLGSDNDPAAGPENPDRNKAKLIPTFVDNNLPEVDFFMKLMILKHEIDNDLSWMTHGNTIFWYWNNPQWESYDSISVDQRNPRHIQDRYNGSGIQTKWNLYTLLLEPNVYFLELEHLSDPKFLKWLQSKDESWKTVNKIDHKYKTKRIFYDNYDLFWKEYSEGKILQDKCLVNPLYNLKTNVKSDYVNRLCKILKIENYLINQIRNDHDRYLSKSLNLK